MANQARVTGWWVFAGILLGIAGFLDVVWGIAAISDSKFFTPNSVWVVSSLHTWGWITLIVGVIEIIAAFSLFSGGGFGRVMGIIAGSIGAIAALAGTGATPFAEGRGREGHQAASGPQGQLRTDAEVGVTQATGSPATTAVRAQPRSRPQPQSIPYG